MLDRELAGRSERPAKESRFIACTLLLRPHASLVTTAHAGVRWVAMAINGSMLVVAAVVTAVSRGITTGGATDVPWRMEEVLSVGYLPNTTNACVASVSPSNLPDTANPKNSKTNISQMMGVGKRGESERRRIGTDSKASRDQGPE